MSKLSALLSISRMQSQREHANLEKKRQSIVRLNKQLSDLVQYARSYQDTTVSSDSYIPALFGHRQLFITQLGEQIGELSDRVSTLKDSAAECEKRWQFLEARQQALESMYERKCLEDKKTQYVKELKEVDDIASSRHSGLDGSTRVLGVSSA